MVGKTFKVMKVLNHETEDKRKSVVWFKGPMIYMNQNYFLFERTAKSGMGKYRETIHVGQLIAGEYEIPGISVRQIKDTSLSGDVKVITKRKRRKWTNQVLQEALKLREQGLSYQAIADRLHF